MSLIRVRELSKIFPKFNRREGIWGSIRDLVHREYSDFVAVDKISFDVEPGELLGYIGPNGAGKSTSIKMLTGILKPTSGEMDVLGYHPFRDRKKYTQHIGVVFGQRTQLWWDIAAIESFKLLAKIYEVSDAEFSKRLGTLSEILELKDLLHTPVRKLSLGQRIRCDLAASLLHNPKVLFLDEPTIGLDAVGKDATRTFLRKINQQFNVTIILTTHDLKEIEELCQRIMILDHGKIIYNGSLHSIRNIPGLRRHVTIDFPGEVPLEKLRSPLLSKATLEREGERRVVLQFDPQEVATIDLVREVVSQTDIADMVISEASIEEVIMKIYKAGAV